MGDTKKKKSADGRGELRGAGGGAAARAPERRRDAGDGRGSVTALVHLSPMCSVARGTGPAPSTAVGYYAA